MTHNIALLSQVWDEIVRFFRNLAGDISSGWLLFGTPADIILMVVDVLVTSLAVYFVLKLMADTRAWQLFKGILFILAFTFICELIGLQTINYVLANSLSVLAIGFVVIFQPELRRALETVGRRSLRIFNTVAPEQDQETRSVHNIIESIVIACEHMAATYTGALIVLERETRLGELISGTAVVLDSALTSTMLEQIFYKGSPLHDGAVLVRDDRIYAARVHIPLSDNYHLRKDYGTRHRAAVGASEIGDAIGIVVSEERGQISVTMGGRLYPIENADALRALLHKIFTPKVSDKGTKATLRSVFMNVVHEPDETIDGVEAPRTDKSGQPGRMLLLLRIASLVISIVLWFYVQLNQNPVRTVLISNVPIQLINAEEVMADRELVYSRADSTVAIRFQVRQKYYDMISRENVIAEIDFQDIDFDQLEEDLKNLGQSTQKLEVDITVDGLASRAYAVLSREPAEQSVVLAPAPATESVPGD